MFSLWIGKIWAKLGGWAAAVAAAIGLGFTVFLMGRSSGKKIEGLGHAKEELKRVGDEIKAVEKIDEAHEEQRAEVDKEIDKIQDVGPVKVADAPKDSAQQKLRDW